MGREHLQLGHPGQGKITCWAGQRGTSGDFIGYNLTDELFISGIFHLIFLGMVDHG